MKKLIFLAVFVLCALGVSAQDYFLTGDSNRSPVRVANFGGLNDLLKEQGKNIKYQIALLDIKEKSAVFALAPVYYKQELEESGELLFKDIINPDIRILITTAKENIPLAQAVKKIKQDKDPDGTTQLISEKNITLNGRPAAELVFEDEDGKSAVFLINYGMTIAATLVAPERVLERYSGDARNILSSLGTAVISSAPVSSASAQPETAREHMPAVSTFDRPVVTDDKNSKVKTVSFDYDIRKYSFETPLKAAVNADGERINFKIPGKAGSVFYLEFSGQKSREYNEKLLKDNGKGLAFRQSASRNIKLGRKNVRFVQKTALNKSAGNYFFKEGDINFVLSYLSSSQDSVFFDAAAKNLITSFKSAMEQP